MSLPEPPVDMPGLRLVEACQDCSLCWDGWAELRPEAVGDGSGSGPPLARMASSKAGGMVGSSVPGEASEEAWGAEPGVQREVGHARGWPLLRSLPSGGVASPPQYGWGNGALRHRGIEGLSCEKQMPGAPWTGRSGTQWAVHIGVLSGPKPMEGTQP